MRDYLALKSAKALSNQFTDYTYLSEILSKRKKREYRLLNQQQITDIFNYAFKAVYGEIIKTILIFSIAYFLHILLPVFLISTTFAILRTVMGGCHMDTFYKCMVSTTILFVGLGKVVSLIDVSWKIDNIILVFIIGAVCWISLQLVLKYAPRDTPTKIISNVEEIRKFKKKSINYVVALSVIMLILTMINQQLIVLSLLTGLIFEIFTITPLGVKSFHGVRDLVNSILKSKEVVEERM